MQEANLSLIPETSGRRQLVSAKLEHFAKCTLVLFKAFIFIWVRDDPMLAFKGDIPKNKGKLVAAEGGEDNLILWAFNERERITLKLKAIQLTTESIIAESKKRNVPEPVEIEIRSVTDLEQYQFSPTPEYVKLIKSVFDPLGATKFESIAGNELTEKVSPLSDLLQGCLNQHIIKRVKDPKKHKHYAWDFVQTNIGRVGTAMIVFGQVMEDMEIAK